MQQIALLTDSLTALRIDKTGCKSELIVEGRNNWWTLLIAIAALLVIAAIFYVGRFFYNRRKENEGSETFKNKVSQRLNSLDAFRG